MTGKPNDNRVSSSRRGGGHGADRIDCHSQVGGRKASRYFTPDRSS